MSTVLTPQQVNEGFLLAPPLIDSRIRDLSILTPNWMADLYKISPWPNGNGTEMVQLNIRGEMPPIERGTGDWRKLPNASGCSPCSPPDCAYNWTYFGGHGIDRKVAQLMHRDFRTPDYCVKEIETTAHFQQIFGFIVQNIFRQTQYFKEENVGKNFLTMLAKKFVVDSAGPKSNPNNPYVYRDVGSAKLSALNIYLLEAFYEIMRRMPDVVPFDVVDGKAVYAISCSDQLLANMFRFDNNLRQDVRFSGLANDLLMKYNFMSTIRGMFINAPILYPRRFKVVSGALVEVQPFINGVPAEIGAYTYNNPEYDAATHEEVLLYGMQPFEIFTQKSEESLGGGTSFGPGFSFMENWAWINPMTETDPMRRVGYFATEATIALSTQNSEGIFGIVVERPSVSLTALWNPVPECPPDVPSCNNEVPTVTCPCALLSGPPAQNPMAPTHWYFPFVTPVTGTEGNPINLQLDNGAYITGTLVAISDDNMTAEISFTDGLPNGVCTGITGIYCDSSLGCSATVQATSDCRAGETNVVKALLSNPIKALAEDDEIVAYFGDCTTATMVVVSVDVENLIWTLAYGDGFGPTDNPDGSGSPDPTDGPLNADLTCDRGGIWKVCVPSTTDATCGACEATMTVCSGAQD